MSRVISAAVTVALITGALMLGGAPVWVVLGLFGAVTSFVYLAMDAGRYRWATELIGRSIDSVVARSRRVLALIRRT